MSLPYLSCRGVAIRDRAMCNRVWQSGVPHGGSICTDLEIENPDSNSASDSPPRVDLSVVPSYDAVRLLFAVLLIIIA
jgi:hypothetical protein